MADHDSTTVIGVQPHRGALPLLCRNADIRQLTGGGVEKCSQTISELGRVRAGTAASLDQRINSGLLTPKASGSALPIGARADILKVEIVDAIAKQHDTDALSTQIET